MDRRLEEPQPSCHNWPEEAVLLAHRANDLQLSLEVRAKAVYSLFEEYVRPGTRLIDFLALVGKPPSWLREQDIEIVEVSFGGG